jgi:predicted nuclease of predicted toxin-antitoxin system
VKFLLDESSDYRLAPFLRGRGHDVTAIAKDYPAALSDREVLAIARRERRVLITNDLDFGQLIVQESLPHRGVILFRLRSASLSLKESRLEFILLHYESRLDQFLTVTESRVRPHRP